MSSMEFIVQNLRSLFNFDISLVSFSEKSGKDLIELLSQTFSKLSNIFAGQVGDQQKDTNFLVQKIAQFLRSVKYQPSVDQSTFLSGLASGSADVIYPIFKWVLHPAQKDQIAERAFVGYYLSDIQLPDDILNDQDCVQIRQQTKVLQNMFIQKHKELSDLRKKGQDPNEVRRSISKLEKEQDLLQEKIEKTLTKVKVKVPQERFEELSEVCSALRRQQDEELHLQSSLSSQQYQFEFAQDKYSKAVSRLQDIKQSFSPEASPESILLSLQEETRQNRIAVNEKLPRETEQKHTQLSVVQYVLQESAKGDGWSRARLEELQRSNSDKREEIEAIQARRQESASNTSAGDIQTIQQRQVAQMVARKKEELVRTVEELYCEKTNLQHSYDEASRKAASVEASISDEDRRSLEEKLNELSQECARIKSRSTEARAEQLTLDRTLNVLQGMEGASGTMVRGLRDQNLSRTAKQLGEVSVAKIEVDEMKGLQLEEISQLVKDINSSIKEKKAKLAPNIKELRTLRDSYKQIESHYAEKKKEHQANTGKLNARIGNLASEEHRLRSAVDKGETMYHLLNCSSKLLATSQKRVSNPTTAERVLRKYCDKLEQQERTLKQYRIKADHLSQSHGASVEQVQAMQALSTILDLKLNTLSRGNVGIANFDETAGTGFGMGGGETMTMTGRHMDMTMGGMGNTLGHTLGNSNVLEL